MSEIKYAAICESGHIIDWKNSHESLNPQGNCHHCGSEIIRKCPSCREKTVFAKKVPQKDNSTKFKRDDYCRSCGSAFPWGPDIVTQYLHKKGILTRSSSNQPKPRNQILPPKIQEELSDTKYGHEVEDHIRDGDECYKERLWLPALSMYVHAYEWTIIAYLESNGVMDVITQERDGEYFNLAGREPNLLDVVTRHANLDQKTIERIQDLSRAERRWMAHHKSGKVLRDEVDSVRSRLGVLLDTLF